MKLNFRWLVFFLVVLIFLVFYKAFEAQYLRWDDDVLILNNPLLALPFLQALKTAFTSFYHGDYFPLTLLSYWFDYQLMGFNPVFQHVENLLLHGLAASLLLECLRKLTGNIVFSFLVVLVFAIHPLQVEPVMWLSERKSLLSAVFTFLSLRFYLESFDGRRAGWWYGLSIFAFGLAGLMKATALLMPLLFLLLDYFRFAGSRRLQWARFSILGVMAGSLIGLRIWAYASGAGIEGRTIFTSGYWWTIPFRAFYALGFYLRSFIYPSGPSAIYPDFILTPLSVGVAVVVALAVVAASWYLWKKREMVPLFFASWFLLFLVPVLQIFPRINFTNDRYMYLPIVGLAGVILWPLRHFMKRRSLQVFVGLLLLVMALVSNRHSEAWRTNQALWKKTLEVVPQSMIALNNLALDYQEVGDLAAAVPLYEKIISQDVEDTNKKLAYNNLANIYADRSYVGFSPAKAIELYKAGLSRVRIVRDSYELRTNLAMVYMTTSELGLAREMLKDLLRDLNAEPDYRFKNLRVQVERLLRAL